MRNNIVLKGLNVFTVCVGGGGGPGGGGLNNYPNLTKGWGLK